MRSVLDPLSYIRGPLVTVFGGIFTLLQSAVVILTAAVFRTRKAIDFACVTMWAKPMLWISGVELEIRGTENLNGAGKGFLILFSHSSNFDIPVLFRLPHSFRFAAKIELFKVPFFGRAMAMCGVLPIDRGDRSKVMKIYENAINRVNNGECFALAPEGTRQKVPKIGPFKRGPFIFAANAQADIVPVVIAGAYEVMPKNTIWVNMGRWKRKVIMEILPRVSTAGLDPDNVTAVLEKVHRDMEVVHDRNHAEIMAATRPLET